ncbi:Crp/Fnr family transcriptional regulator [Pseudomonas botevensis]|uniref:Crp/Fnr family transcriptional regulator n=1 Tax=Pseudomonas botevensis TaxID=2842352 RepID=UPI001C3C3D58|nr:helix-turn-helix domain-containing protein [Pseudomonas botevensis]MBV4475246.1 helix-turn-helix domain-containing protein [Pseudomonas botevensis]
MLRTIDREILGHYQSDSKIQRMNEKKGRFVFRQGSIAAYLFKIKAGSVKVVIESYRNFEHLLDFKMAGDNIGLDTFVGDPHRTSAIALEDTEICKINISRLKNEPASQLYLHGKIHSATNLDVDRLQKKALLLAKMTAEQRLCWLLCDLSEKYASMGFSAQSLYLKMSRNEIASYLGLRMETVCRCFTKLHELSLINVDGAKVEIIHLEKIKNIAMGIDEESRI